MGKRRADLLWRVRDFFATGREKPRTYKTGPAIRTMSVESKPDCRMPMGTNSPPPNAPEGSTPEAGVTPSVADFRQGSKKDVRKNTNEAGMYMKTHKSRARCPEKSRTFMS